MQKRHPAQSIPPVRRHRSLIHNLLSNVILRVLFRGIQWLRKAVVCDQVVYIRFRLLILNDFLSFVHGAGVGTHALVDLVVIAPSLVNLAGRRVKHLFLCALAAPILVEFYVAGNLEAPANVSKVGSLVRSEKETQLAFTKSGCERSWE